MFCSLKTDEHETTTISITKMNVSFFQMSLFAHPISTYDALLNMPARDHAKMLFLQTFMKHLEITAAWKPLSTGLNPVLDTRLKMINEFIKEIDPETLSYYCMLLASCLKPRSIVSMCVGFDNPSTKQMLDTTLQQFKSQLASFDM